MKTNIMEYIAEERKLQGITATEFAARLPFSRQRTESLIAAGDAPFKHARLMLNALGKDVDILTKEGNLPDFINTAEDRENLFASIADSRIYFCKLEKIIELMGYTFEIADIQAADSAPGEKKEQ